MKISNTKKRLDEVMQDRGLRQVDILKLCEPFCNTFDIKLTKSDLSQYISGKTEPNQGKLFILSKALDINEAWLMGFDVLKERAKTPIITSSKLSNEETNHIETVRKLSVSSKNKVLMYAKKLLDLEQVEDDIELTIAARGGTSTRTASKKELLNIISSETDWSEHDI